jgi:hypothetical protein
MFLAIRLDGIPLFVQDISTDEGRMIVEQKIPGMGGSLLQDLGKKLTRILLKGTFYGEKAKDDLEKLRVKYLTGEPIALEADITAALDVPEVIIRTLDVREIAGEPNYFQYVIQLCEHVENREQKSDQVGSPSQLLEDQAKLESQSFLQDIQNLVCDLGILDQLKSIAATLGKSEKEISEKEFRDI